VNRLSMGIQALDDDDLRALGRMHSVAEALSAFDLARLTFPRVSFDLIYARQGQAVAAWRAELARALALAVDHLSLYQLTIEPGTRFGDLAARGRLRGLPGAALAADLYVATQELCDAAGMPAYEISNHARAGAEGRHNLVYWRYGDFAGIGPGAHGRLTVGGVRRATLRPRDPEAWLAAAETGAPPAWERLSAPDAAAEMLIMGLRLREGIDLRRWQALAGQDSATSVLAELIALGHLAQDGPRIRTTAAGRPVLDALLRRLLHDAPAAQDT
jgi:oxygen-independent coproporphyrinogen-3 oxidase